MTPERLARVWQLNKELDELNRRSNEIHSEIDRIRTAQANEDFPCECVRINGVLGLNTMDAVERAKRYTLQATGIVSRLLSADLTCRHCHGTGKPQ